MQGLIIDDVTKRYGPVTAVENVSLGFDSGKMVCFLGPSGCGKTTLLRMIAGLDLPTNGRISFDGADMTSVPPHKRDIGMVFQSFALFPHLSVGENIAYGMRIRGASKAECAERTKELLELIHLPGVEDRRISQLSGGQRQRVAIARALALDPKIFLLDEPMSALDANLRESMQIELRLLQQRLGITTIVVTHDQTEAMTMADEIVVMGHANVHQVGEPQDIYKNPVNRFVADFIGTSNLLPAKMVAPDQIELHGETLKIATNTGDFAAGTEVLLLNRPEEVMVRNRGQKKPSNSIPGTVSFVRDIGATIEILVDCQGQEVISMLTPKDSPNVEAGMEVYVEMPVEACSVLAV